MPRVVNTAFDANETVKVYPIHSGLSVFALEALVPGRLESGPDYVAKEVNPVRGQPQLQDFLRFAGVQDVRAAEFHQRLVGVLDILRRGINPKIHILGVSRFGVIDEREASDNEIPDPVFFQKLKDILEILDGVHFQDVFRSLGVAFWRALMTFSTSFRRAINADRRSSGVWLCQKSKSHCSAFSKSAVTFATIRLLR
jgi:hypothetical protein